MHPIDVVIDNRITCSFIDTAETGNVIFCRPLEESLDNISLITTKNGEFIHKYIQENGENYLVTNIHLPNGDVHEDVYFKLVVCESGDLPLSTINTAAFGSPLDHQPIRDTSSLEAEYLIETAGEEIEVSEPFNIVIPESVEPVIQKAKNLETHLLKEQTRLQKERENLNKERIVLENNKRLQKTLEDYKTELLQETFLINEHQKELLEKSIRDLSSSLQEQFDGQQINVEKYLDTISTANLEELKKYQDEQVDVIKGQINELLAERQTENSIATDKLLIERISELDSIFTEKLIAELESYKRNITSEISNISTTLNSLINEKLIENNNTVDQLLVNRAGILQDQFNDKLSNELIKYTQDILSEAKIQTQSIADDIFSEKVKSLVSTLEEQRDTLDTTAAEQLNEVVSVLNKQKNDLDEVFAEKAEKVDAKLIEVVSILDNRTKELNEKFVENNKEIDAKLASAENNYKKHEAGINSIIVEKLKDASLTVDSYKLSLKEAFAENAEAVTEEVIKITREFEERIPVLEKKIRSFEANINDLTVEKIVEVTNAVRRLGEDIQSKLPDLDSRIETFNEKAEDISSRISRVAKNVEDQIPALEAKINGVEAIINEHKRNLNDVAKQKIVEVADIIKKFGDDVQGRLPILDDKIVEINDKISSLINEKRTLNTLIDGTKQYTDSAVSKGIQDAKDYARRILELGGGGGSNAVQYANGGTMNGSLNITGQYLSGGIDLASIFSGGGGGGGYQTLSFSSTTANLSISNGNTVSLSALSGAGGGPSGPIDRLDNGTVQVTLCADNILHFPNGTNSTYHAGGSGGYIDLRGGDGGSDYNGGDGGYIRLTGGGGGGDAAGSSGGFIELNGFTGDGGGGSAGYIQANGANHNGGAGYLKMNASYDTSGGYIDTSAGDNNGNGGGAGGYINTSGGIEITSSGGYINTSNGGGSINTTGTGYIQFGYDTQRTTLSGIATANRTIYLPNADGTLALNETQAYTLVNATSSIQPINGGNTASGYNSVVAGGTSNLASGNCSFIGGGDSSCATNALDVVIGGNHNCATGGTSFVGGGRLSTASATYAVVVGGNQNSSTGYAAFVGGGYNNNASGEYSSILGGVGNTTNSQANTFILGSNITALQPNYTYVNNLSSQGTIAVANIKINTEPSTFANPVTASGTFLIVNINGTNKALQLWDYSS